MAAIPSLPVPTDTDAQETREWLDALSAVIQQEGPERAHYLIEKQIELARAAGVNVAYSANTAYVNTIPPDQEVRSPGDHRLEDRIRSYVRWNALAMVLRANKGDSNLGGHISSFASAATLYDVGFNHFWRAPTEQQGGDMVYMQGHSSPGIYARAFMLGRLTEEQMDHFRREVDGKGLSSYPHPWLMPDFWQFPTVSMGLGPLMAIFQARFLRYLQDRKLSQTEDRKVWAFCGDGEMGEPESLGVISLAGREKLDNLIFVINCNLQRLDGPVWGGGQIIQELESIYRGAKWNVIKVIWGSEWDELFAQDSEGVLKKRLLELVDGEYQDLSSKDGAYLREHFFGKDPQLKAMVDHLSDESLRAMLDGGHDPQKVYAAYKAAVEHKGQPTVILAKTVKGFGMGKSGEALNRTHSTKKMSLEDLRAFAKRFDLPLTDQQLENLEFVKPKSDSPEIRYLLEKRKQLGGYVPSRLATSPSFTIPPLHTLFEKELESTHEREISSTMAFVRVLSALLKDKTRS